MEQAEYTLARPVCLSLPAEEIDKLLQEKDGACALVYLALQRAGGRAVTAETVGLTEQALRGVMAKLERLGLVSARKAAPLPPADELPQYTAEDLVRRSKEDAAFQGVRMHAEQLYGRKLTTPETRTLLGMYDYLGFPGDVLMEVSHLTGRYMPTCQDVSFQLRAGEVLGVAGLVGSRRTELLSTIFGIMSRESGEITLKGKPISNKTPRQSIKNGFAMLTEERRATGIFPYANILFNTVISNLGSYKKGPLLSDKKMASDTDWSISSMHIKTPSQKTLIKNLSGGNQQKVILGRWLLTQPEVLLLDEPTRGIDVGAKYEIYELILQLAKQGKAVMMVSSEMPELIGICDRILVMSNGRMAGILERGKDFGGVENEQETIMRLAAQYV